MNLSKETFERLDFDFELPFRIWTHKPLVEGLEPRFNVILPSLVTVADGEVILHGFVQRKFGGGPFRPAWWGVLLGGFVGYLIGAAIFGADGSGLCVMMGVLVGGLGGVLLFDRHKFVIPVAEISKVEVGIRKPSLLMSHRAATRIFQRPVQNGKTIVSHFELAKLPNLARFLVVLGGQIPLEKFILSDASTREVIDRLSHTK